MSQQSTSMAAARAPAAVRARSMWESTILMARNIAPTASYLMKTEVHTFAFSVAANAILSFFPFVVLLLTVTRRVFHSRVMFDVVVQLLRDYLPVSQDFIVRNLTALATAHRGVQIFSVVMLLITSTGVFLPLEVALNQVWGFKKNRSYLGNQLVSLGLAASCGVLALMSVALTAGNQLLLERMMGGYANPVVRAWTFGVMKGFGMAASIAIFFLIFWLLPNGKVPIRAVMPAAILIGLLWEAGKNMYMLALPWLNFQEVYGPFSISVTLMFWAFLSGLLLLAGAHLSASGQAEQIAAKAIPS
jgi:YihY family inner membrane protein